MQSIQCLKSVFGFELSTLDGLVSLEAQLQLLLLVVTVKIKGGGGRTLSPITTFSW